MKTATNRSKFGFFFAWLLTSWNLLLPETALAVQGHGGAEGLISHQIGHILFISGMAYMLFRINRMRPSGTGWLEFRLFLVLIILWNCLTFTGHWLRETVDPEKFITLAGDIIAYDIKNFTDFIFYFSQLDHLLLVPSFIFLLLALKKWGMEP